MVCCDYICLGASTSYCCLQNPNIAPPGTPYAVWLHPMMVEDYLLYGKEPICVTMKKGAPFAKVDPANFQAMVSSRLLQPKGL